MENTPIPKPIVGFRFTPLSILIMLGFTLLTVALFTAGYSLANWLRS